MLSIEPETEILPEHPVERIAGDPARGLLLVCEHASNAVPEDLGRLGVPEPEFSRHIAYDIGAAEVPQLLVFNKRDLLPESQRPRLPRDLYDLEGRTVPRIFVSSHTGENLDLLRQALGEQVLARSSPCAVENPVMHETDA